MRASTTFLFSPKNWPGPREECHSINQKINPKDDFLLASFPQTECFSPVRGFSSVRLQRYGRFDAVNGVKNVYTSILNKIVTQRNFGCVLASPLLNVL
jgi:hypothetical protein